MIVDSCGHLRDLLQVDLVMSLSNVWKSTDPQSRCTSFALLDTASSEWEGIFLKYSLISSAYSCIIFQLTYAP
jgi:hypothetical protein